MSVLDSPQTGAVGAPVTSGTCFGFRVRSTVPLHYLRAGHGPELGVSTPAEVGLRPDDRLLIEWTPKRGVPHVKLYRSGRRYRVWVDGGGWFVVDPEASHIDLPETGDPVRREERLWGLPLLLCLLHRGDLPLHAAAVEINGEAVLLAAPTTFGKTTLAAAFEAAGHRLLAEDLSCLRHGLDGSVSVVPGPAMLRLRPDTAEALAVPGARTVGHSDGRVHLALGPEGRGTCNPVAVRSIVLLRHSDDGVRLEHVPAVHAIRDLWSLSFNLPKTADRARCFADLTALADKVPVWNLHRPRSFARLPAVVEAVANRA